MPPLYTYLWLPKQPPRGLVHLVHGIGEHMGRYDSFATFLSEQGYAVFGCDAPGHGKTARTPEEQGFFAEKNGWMQTVDCLTDLAQSRKQLNPELPFFLFGHSIGSFLVRTIMIDSPDLADGILLSGTGQPPHRQLSFAEKVLSGAVSLLGATAKSERMENLVMGNLKRQFSPARTTKDWLSRDPAVVDQYVADPLCDFTPTVSLLRDMIDGLLYIGNPTFLKNINPDTPVFLFSGAEDPVGERGAGVERVYDSLVAAGCNDVEMLLYPEGRHEMLNEINHEEVYQDILTWLNEKMETIHGVS